MGAIAITDLGPRYPSLFFPGSRDWDKTLHARSLFWLGVPESSVGLGRVQQRWRDGLNKDMPLSWSPRWATESIPLGCSKEPCREHSWGLGEERIEYISCPHWLGVVPRSINALPLPGLWVHQNGCMVSRVPQVEYKVGPTALLLNVWSRALHICVT